MLVLAPVCDVLKRTTNSWPYFFNSWSFFFASLNNKQTWTQLSFSVSFFLSWVLPTKCPVSHTWRPALKVYCHLLFSFFVSPGSPIPYILLFFYLLFHRAFQNTVVLLWVSFIPHVKQCMWSLSWRLIGSYAMCKRVNPLTKTQMQRCTRKTAWRWHDNAVCLSNKMLKTKTVFEAQLCWSVFWIVFSCIFYFIYHANIMHSFVSLWHKQSEPCKEHFFFDKSLSWALKKMKKKKHDLFPVMIENLFCKPSWEFHKTKEMYCVCVSVCVVERI